ncbi:DnaB-like helicase N-terminal domain-containing protein [Nocardioides bruguierae]|uniref:DnaB-like helicase N-terminal domain-containing protein n=1 Tax=Nocardioides bruguierae TaxID=2945102 RepID=UPI0020228E46|nr:DnaB-like helicase N-terminal domain-containing protein [Nocardioides bruguierae]MCL8026335.1 hypothetical protein [Nocardioides bruguierae]
MTNEGPRPTRLRPVTTDGPPPDPWADTWDDHPTTNSPGDRDAERALLDALITDPTGTLPHITHLTADHFYWPTHTTIWDAWHHLAETHAAHPDGIAIAAHLAATRQLDAARALPELTGTSHPGMAPIYATRVRETARARVLTNLGATFNDLGRRGGDLQTAFETGLDTLEQALRAGWGHDPTTANNTGLKDLSWVGTGTPPAIAPPTWCQRADGTALFYAGKVNGVFGDPEAAKTWLAQIAVVEALHAGHTAAMIDVDHNGPDHTAARLLLLGATIDQIADPNRFRYYEPEDGDELRAAVDDVCRVSPAVVLIDSLGEIFPMLGVKTNDGDEITSAMRLVCTRPALTGSCVITIDHLPKSPEVRASGFAIGSIAKKRMIRGSYIRAEAKTQPAPGAVGRVTLRIEKDTAGELRKSSGGGYAGTFTLNSTQPHTTTWVIGREETPRNDDGTVRPTNIMERISRFIEDHDGCTIADIKHNVSGKSETITNAIASLVADGHVARIKGARNRTHHQVIAPYRAREDDRANPEPTDGQDHADDVTTRAAADADTPGPSTGPSSSTSSNSVPADTSRRPAWEDQ